MVIERQCVSCRKRVCRSQLIRIVYDRKTLGLMIIQPSQEERVSSGRSAYICVSTACLGVAVKGKKIQRALKTTIPDDIFNCLSDIVKGKATSGPTEN